MSNAARRRGGFTLIELLVVMIIIGVLAAIAIPVFLNQRGKAHDSATKADVSNLGKEVATMQERRDLALMARDQPLIGPLVEVGLLVLHAVALGVTLELAVADHR